MARAPAHVLWVKHCAKQFIWIISFSHHNDYALGTIIRSYQVLLSFYGWQSWSINNLPKNTQKKPQGQCGTPAIWLSCCWLGHCTVATLSCERGREPKASSNTVRQVVGQRGRACGDWSLSHLAVEKTAGHSRKSLTPDPTSNWWYSQDESEGPACIWGPSPHSMLLQLRTLAPADGQHRFHTTQSDVSKFKWTNGFEINIFF